MREVLNQGQKANAEGEGFRHTVASMLHQQGRLCEVHAQGRTPARSHECIRQEWQTVRSFTRNEYSGIYVPMPLVGKSLYLKPFRVDFVAWRWDWEEPLLIACRHQGSSGSVLEKIPFLVGSLHRGCEPYRYALALSGDAILDDGGVMNYLRTQQEISRGRLTHLFEGSDQLRHWLIAGMTIPKVEPMLL